MKIKKKEDEKEKNGRQRSFLFFSSFSSFFYFLNSRRKILFSFHFLCFSLIQEEEFNFFFPPFHFWGVILPFFSYFYFF
jgi:hypothetical protein